MIGGSLFSPISLKAGESEIDFISGMVMLLCHLSLHPGSVTAPSARDKESTSKTSATYFTGIRKKL